MTEEDQDYVVGCSSALIIFGLGSFFLPEGIAAWGYYLGGGAASTYFGCFY